MRMEPATVPQLPHTRSFTQTESQYHDTAAQQGFVETLMRSFMMAFMQVLLYALGVVFLLVKLFFFSIFDNKPESALLLTFCDPFSLTNFDHLCLILHDL